MMIHKWIVVVGLMLAVFFIYELVPENLQAAGIKMAANLGFAGYITPDRWVPLKIHLNGECNQASLELIKVDDEGNNSPIESFAVYNRNLIEIPVYIGVNITKIKLRLRAENLILAEQEIAVKKFIFPGHLVLAINIPGIEQQAIERSLLPDEPVLVAPVSYSDLPGLAAEYDGVSRIVMNDPGPVLTPNQINSLRSWLAGGGKMVLFSNQDASGSLVKEFHDSALEITKSKTAGIKIGLGSITLIPLSFHQKGNNKAPRIWRQLLKIKPYSQDDRITMSKCFPVELLHRAQHFKLVRYVIISIIIWALIVLILLRLKSFQWRYLLIFTILSITLAFPLANWLRANWQRGADTNVRAVFLPGNGGVIINAKINIGPTEFLDTAKLVSPWGVGVTLGKNETGTIRGGNGRLSFWRHQALRLSYVCQTLKPGLIDLTGRFTDVSLKYVNEAPLVLNNTRLTQITAPVKETFLYDHQTWFRLMSNAGERPHWQKASEPQWLRADHRWLSGLRNLIPENSWLIGRGRMPAGLVLKIEGFELSEVHWAMPYR